jgi:hypothetical protein
LLTKTQWASVLTSALLLAVAGAACSSNPAQPSTGTGSVLAPRASQPSAGAQIRNVDQPVTLIVTNAVVTRPAGTTYKFEIATDPAFGQIVQSKDNVAEGSAGQTSVRLDPLAPGTTYYWHARAQGGGTTGVFGATLQFTIGQAVIISSPAPLGPLTGDQTSPRPTLRVANATRQGPAGPITYRFEISTSSTFAPVIATATVAESSNQTLFTPTADLPSTGTLFWRVTAIDASNGITSAPSAVQSFAASQPWSQAGLIANALGVVLWPGSQPTGANGQATLGDNWDIQTLYHAPSNTFFQSPTLEMLRFFDLFDRGLDPQSAIDWLNSHGYSTAAQWYPPPEKGVLGLQYVYLAARYKVLVHGTWDIVVKGE